MLKDDGMKAGRIALDGVAVLIIAPITDRRRPFDVTAHSRHGQTALPESCDVFVEHLVLGIDQHRRGHGLDVGIAWRRLDPEDHHALHFAYLRRREPRTVGSVHCLEHVRDQLV